MTPCCSLVTGVLFNVLVMSPAVSLLQAALTRRILLSVYDDIRWSHMGFAMFYDKSKWVVWQLEFWDGLFDSSTVH
jgi:hypothetical protein